MKKFTDFLKPHILIIFGALLFIYYLNFLSYGGAGLALGIFAVILSAYYLVVGILLVLMGDKFSPTCQKMLGTLSVALFAIFMFVGFLITVIEASGIMGPTAWVIKILSIVASLAFAVIYIVSKFCDKPVLLRFSYLFALIFVLALLLDILFDVAGDSRLLGNIDVLLVVIYAVYTFYLFGSLEKIKEVPSQDETKQQ